MLKTCDNPNRDKIWKSLARPTHGEIRATYEGCYGCVQMSLAYRNGS
jgi:hypothetical protein